MAAEHVRVKRSSARARFGVIPGNFFEIGDAECFPDGSGCCAEIRVSAGVFACIGKPFYFESLEAFVADVRHGYAELSGTAELKHRYEDEFIRMEFKPLGQIVVSGLLIGNDPLGCCLEFAFEADQTFCPSFIRELESIAAEIHG